MFVHIPDTEGTSPLLCSTGELGSLSVRVDAGSADWDALSRTLRAAAAGDATDGHAWLDISWLRAAAGASGADWHYRFHQMLVYASARDWLSAGGGRIRAHVDWGVGPLAGI